MITDQGVIYSAAGGAASGKADLQRECRPIQQFYVQTENAKYKSATRETNLTTNACSENTSVLGKYQKAKGQTNSLTVCPALSRI